MANLTINGRSVTVDDSFLKLSPEEQNATVEEIAASLPSEKGALQNVREGAQKVGTAATAGAVKGLASIPSLAGDALLNAGSGLNYLSRLAASKITGDKDIVDKGPDALMGLPLTGAVNQGVDAAVDASGMPQFESPTGKIVGETIGGAAGAGAVVGAAKALPGTLGKLRSFLTASPKTQIAAGGVAGGASEAVNQAGGTPWGQMGAGVGGAVGTSLLLSAISKGRTGPRINALTPEGQERIAGDIFRRSATNPDEALVNAEIAREFIPGSRPLGVSATADPGIITVGKKAERFAEDRGAREVANNDARQAAIEKVGLRPGAFDRIDAKLDDLTKKLPTETFANETPVNIDGIIKKFEALTDPHTHSEATIARASQALRYLQNPAFHTPTGAVMLPSQLYQLGRRQIGALTKPGSGAEDGLVAAARHEIADVIPEIDNVISSGAPAFEKNYLRPYRNLRQQRDELEALQSVRDRSTTDVGMGSRQWRPGSYLQMRAESKQGERLVKGNPKNRVTAETLSPNRRRFMENMDEEMRRENRINARGTSARGSDTAQNLNFESAVDDAVKDNLPFMAKARDKLAGAVESATTTAGVAGWMGGGAPLATAGVVAARTIPRVLRAGLDERIRAAGVGVRAQAGRAFNDPAEMAAILRSAPPSQANPMPWAGATGRGALQGFMNADIETRKKRGRYR